MQTERTFFDELKNQYKYGGMTIKLIFINVLVFLFIGLLGVVARLGGGSLGANMSWFTASFFVLPTDFSTFITHPWTLFTNIFSHFGFWHLALNMLFLYFAGRTFEQIFDSKRLLYTYILGGILGGIFEILATFLPVIEPTAVVGASGGVMAVFIALAFYRPNLKMNLFGVLPIRIIFIAILFFLQDFLQLGENDGTAHFAHLGGAVFGMISVQQIHSSSNIVNAFQGFIDRILRLVKGNRTPKMKVHRSEKTRKQTDEEYNADKKQRQEQIDRILDKISKSGYDSLTKNEKDFLFKQSNNR